MMKKFRMSSATLCLQLCDSYVTCLALLLLLTVTLHAVCCSISVFGFSWLLFLDVLVFYY